MINREIHEYNREKSGYSFDGSGNGSGLIMVIVLFVIVAVIGTGLAFTAFHSQKEEDILAFEDNSSLRYEVEKISRHIAEKKTVDESSITGKENTRYYLVFKDGQVEVAKENYDSVKEDDVITLYKIDSYSKSTNLYYNTEYSFRLPKTYTMKEKEQ